MNQLAIVARRVGRTLLLLLVVAAGTTVLVRFAPGFFSDEREIDAKYAEGARSEVQAEQASHQSISGILVRQVSGWTKGDLGESRQFQIPVTELIAPRIQVSALLLIRGIRIRAGCSRYARHGRSAPCAFAISGPAVHTASGNSDGRNGDSLHSC